MTQSVGVQQDLNNFHLSEEKLFDELYKILELMEIINFLTKYKKCLKFCIPQTEKTLPKT